ncbi:hypothetical protein B4W74_09100 [Staphylococcus intermedius]|uniref:Uncharacterized protein n=1 Tax=Staphylococcus intermedius NCTC 11048 TaxID=1141106 RepID=A0A380G563_STAIN|nr:hypothetical protein [Staphylococcus intermedius]PCF64054.1 hypothetical protein B5C04_08750 [Staphylococcus intermedius]PCF78769.1 hypothetical protein B4W74_09100 [Staphylococcus intermedius]PCF79742.1 hypothetical protein B4W70_08740 [Staphylococcus intermedius]PCF85908.1 hypothetical protein B4W76_09195 [Staphylococcus intermedius]PCF89599.1 hypothetical protein B4W75_01805 [Staphylococcus intermedius]
MSEFITIMTFIILLAIQYFLSSKNKYFGFIIPIVFSGFVLFLLITDRLGFISSLAFLVLGLILLIEQWYKGKKKLDK